MNNPYDDYRESLADAKIVSITKTAENEIVVSLCLWNEDDAELRFSGALSFDEPSAKEIEYILETTESYILTAALQAEFNSVPDSHEYIHYTLIDHKEDSVCNIVAKSVAFSLLSEPLEATA